MLFNHKPWLVCAISVSMLAACSRSRPCVEGTAILNFVSFTDAETDSIVLRKYVKDNGFNSLIDSVIISKNNSIYQKSNDTLHILTSMQGEYNLDIHYDYEVYMPYTNKLFRISNIVVEQTEMNGDLTYFDKNICLDPMRSYTLNGQTINTDSYEFYIKD